MKRKSRENKFIFITLILFDTCNFLCDELVLSDEEQSECVIYLCILQYRVVKEKQDTSPGNFTTQVINSSSQLLHSTGSPGKSIHWLNEHIIPKEAIVGI